MADDKKTPEFDSDEQRDAHVEALNSEVVSLKAQGDDRAVEVAAELARLTGRSKRTAARGETRLRGAAAEKRSS